MAATIDAPATAAATQLVFIPCLPAGLIPALWRLADTIYSIFNMRGKAKLTTRTKPLLREGPLAAYLPRLTEGRKGT